MSGSALAFDPALPELQQGFDPEYVVRLFEASGLRLIGGEPPVAVRDCRLQDVQYRPASRCLMTYAMHVEDAEGVSRRTIGVIEVTPGAIRARPFNDDPNLPGLSRAADAAGMRPLFAGVLRNASSAATMEVMPIRYKPEAHCVLRYELHVPSGLETYFGKVMALKGERLAAVHSELHSASRSVPDMPRIPNPVAYWPELGMALLQAIPTEGNLGTRAFDLGADNSRRERWMRRAGRGVAYLHAIGYVPGPHRTIDDDLFELAEYCAPIAATAPGLAERFKATLETLAARARGRREPEPAPSHGALRADQFLITAGDDLALLDWDGFCRANPARDLGNFLAYLDWRAIRRPEEDGWVERAKYAFFDGYESSGGRADAVWLGLYRAVSMLKIAGRRFRRLAFHEWQHVPRLIESAGAAVG